MSKAAFLVLNKPLGCRSTKCVELVKKKLDRGAKVGHGGTLDSTASGVIVILLGAATRLSNLVMSLPKCYEAALQLGTQTDTDDASGHIISRAPFDFVTDRKIQEALFSFYGWRMQTPPDISAVHVDGRRAHELARKGKTVKIAPKAVYFEKISQISPIDPNGKVSFRIHCQKGTYIRSFGRDISYSLGTVGHICALKRLSVGPFDLSRSVSLDEFERLSCGELSDKLIPVERLSEILSAYRANDEASEKISRGQSVPLAECSNEAYLTFSGYGEERIFLRSRGNYSVCEAELKNGEIFAHPVINISREEKTK